MRFGIYIHIPHCLQRCHYCDFATIPLSHRVDPSQYTDMLLQEIEARSASVSYKQVSSIYFGGGTPSLLPLADLKRILVSLRSAGFNLSKDCEICIEINPGTIDAKKLDQYLACGVTRFSVGVQTWNNTRLKSLGREHSSIDTQKTLGLLSDAKVNFSADLLFGIATQSLSDLAADVSELLKFTPPHISCYLLTLPTGHPQNIGRAEDGEQAQMFTYLSKTLISQGYSHYEISNFARPGYESKHNLIYWSGEPYWGIGMSAHSYFPNQGPFGVRFWNPPSISLYEKHHGSTIDACHHENLQFHEALTDFAHTRLRRDVGLILSDAKVRFGESGLNKLLASARISESRGLVNINDDSIRLTPSGRLLANQALLDFTFLPSD